LPKLWELILDDKGRLDSKKFIGGGIISQIRPQKPRSIADKMKKAAVSMHLIHNFSDSSVILRVRR
jgi:hypothetical protein